LRDRAAAERFFMVGGPPAVALALSYNRDRVSAQTVESIASHIQRILEGRIYGV